jgi:hypothetical protein
LSKRRYMIIAGAGLIAAILVISAASWRTQTAHNDPGRQNRAAAARGTLSVTERYYAFTGMLARIAEASDRIDSENDKKDINERIHEQNRVTVDVDEVLEEASRVTLPYKTEEERQDVLKRLKGTEDLFGEMISRASDNISEARKSGSRTEEELSEADEAVREMEKGKNFITGRISLVNRSKN